MSKYDEYATLFSTYKFEEYSSVNKDEYKYRGRRAFSSSDLAGIKYDVLADTYRVVAINGKSVNVAGEYYDIIDALISHDSICDNKHRFVKDGKIVKHTNRSIDKFKKKFIDIHKNMLSLGAIAEMLDVPISSVYNIVRTDKGSESILPTKHNPTVVVWDVRDNYESMAEELLSVGNISDAFINDFIGIGKKHDKD